MKHWTITDFLHNSFSIGLKHFYLAEGEVVGLRVFGGSEVRVDGFHSDKFAVFQEGCQFIQFACHETEAVHAGVELDMDWKVCDSAFFQYSAEDFQRVKVRNARLESAVNDFVIVICPCGEDQYRKADT